MHSQIITQFKTDIRETGGSNLKIFDPVRGVFTEGKSAYSGAGIFKKTHTQICIRNPNCINGFFLPRKEVDFLKAQLEN